MNKWEQLLKYLDQAYGFQDQVSSRFRSLKKYYDETGEHVVLVEYRVRRGDAPVIKDKDASVKMKNKKAEADGKLRRVNKKKIDSLLQRINNDAHYIVKTGAAAPLGNDVPQL